jgi:hypothetical protein
VTKNAEGLMISSDRNVGSNVRVITGAAAGTTRALLSRQEPSLPTSPSWLIAISAAAEKRTCRQLSKQKMRCFHPLGFQIVLR